MYRKLYDEGKIKNPFPPLCRGDRRLQEGYICDGMSPQEKALAVLSNPSTWAKYELNIAPRWYQETMLACSARQTVLRCGRRIGKSFMLVLRALHNMSRNKHYRVLIVAPYQNQINILFGFIDKFISDSKTIKNKVKRRVKSPQLLELTNGSLIQGFPSGINSGGKSDKVRGQDADEILIDEIDYLPDGDIDAIVAILASNKNTKISVSSTPSGRKTKYYKFCTHKQDGWKEWHFSSMVSPEWTEQTENMLRGMYSTLAWEHEICLSGDTLVRTTLADKKIKDITCEDFVYDSNFNIVEVAKGATYTGRKQVVKYTLPNDRHIVSTPDHSFPNRSFTKTPIESLDELPVYRDKRYNSSDRDVVLARLVGYNLGDGSCCSTRYQSSFYSSSYSDMDKIVKDLHTIYPGYKGNVLEDVINNSNKKASLVHVDGKRCSVNVSKKITLDLISHGVVRGKKVEQEFNIPDFIASSNDLEVKREFIAALFGAEGSMPAKACDDGYMPHTLSLSMSKRRGVSADVFFDGLVSILKEFGVRSTWTSHPAQFKSANNGICHNTVYALYVHNSFDNIYAFLNKVGYRYCDAKEQAAFNIKCYLECYDYALKAKRNRFEYARILKDKKLSHKEISKRTRLSLAQISKAIAGRIPKRFYNEFPKLDDWLKYNVVGSGVFMPIVKRRKLPKPIDVYNITVGSHDHSYILGNDTRTFNCAEFGQFEEGAFPTKKLVESMQSYTYAQCSRKPNCIYSMGVDWNEHPIGVHMVVVEYDPEYGQFKVVDKKISNDKEFTQTKAVEDIITTYRTWMPDWLWADAGAGGYQIETLKRVANAKPDLRLRKKIRGVVMHEKEIIKDPITKRDVKKQAKALMVDLCVRRVEIGQCIFPRIEDDENMLVDQIRNFKVERFTPNGIPVYSQGKDHTAVAWMVAMYAILLNRTDIKNVKHCKNVGSVPIYNSITGASTTTRSRSISNEIIGSREIKTKQDVQIESFRKVSQPQRRKHVAHIELRRGVVSSKRAIANRSRI